LDEPGAAFGQPRTVADEQDGADELSAVPGEPPTSSDDVSPVGDHPSSVLAQPSAPTAQSSAFSDWPDNSFHQPDLAGNTPTSDHGADEDGTDESERENDPDRRS
jgi:hypothetical protein